MDNPEQDQPAGQRDNQAGQPLPPAQQDLNEGLGAAHQAMLQGGGPTGFQPYKRPTFFVARVKTDIQYDAF